MARVHKFAEPTGQPLDPALKSFIDRIVVPALVRGYLEQQKTLAARVEPVAECATKQLSAEEVE